MRQDSFEGKERGRRFPSHRGTTAVSNLSKLFASAPSMPTFPARAPVNEDDYSRAMRKMDWKESMMDPARASQEAPRDKTG